MIEGGLAPFETPFFFILIDPSKGSWRQLAAAGPSFFGPCGPALRREGIYAGLAVPAATRGPIRPTPGGIYAGLVDPHPPMRGGLTPSSALLPMAGLPAPGPG